jgi:hypothetical protein
MKKKLLFATAGTLLAIQAFAYQPTGNYDMRKMSEEANLIFRGTVIEVDYRESRAKGTARPLPHTFVTFEVDEVLHGDLNRKQFTLRFLGGKTEKGEIMMTSSLPKFDVGDQDLLFVKDNGVSECPLVECSKGRFRVLNGVMYTEEGQRILQDEKGGILAGKTEEHEALSSFSIGDRQFKRHHQSDQTKDGNGEVVMSDRADAYHMNAGYFTDLLRVKVNQALQKSPKSMIKVAQSLDKNKPFYAVQSNPVSLPEPDREASATSKMSEEERAEVKAMNESGGNPVLK